MKCISCGAEVGLTEGKCPYCGREITENASHRRDLKKYKDKNKKIKGEADSIVSSNLPIVISVVVMIFLIIALIIAAYLEDNAYTLRSEMIRKEAEKNHDEYSVIIQEYLDAADYIGFYSFVNNHCIWTHQGPYEDLKNVTAIAGNFTAMVSMVEEVVMYGPEAKVYSQDMSIKSCARCIEDFYNQYSYLEDEIEDDPYKEYIYDIKNQADLILEIYFGLDEAGRAEFFAGSDNARYAYIEGVLLDE